MALLSHNPTTASSQTLQQALTLHQQGSFAHAERLYLEVLAARPADFDALHMLGVLAGQTGRAELAVQLLTRAVLQRGDVAAAYNNLALALTRLDRLGDAVRAYDSIIALEPGNVEAYTQKAKTLYELRRPELALATYERVISVEPDNGLHYWRASLCCLLMGHYATGWKMYEARNNIFASAGTNGLNRASRVRRDHHLWDGREDLTGKTLFIQSEQGFGDILQFCRYVPLLERRGARVILSVPPTLCRMLRSLSSTTQIMSEAEPPPDADRDCFLLSLPFAFSTTLESIPASVPYLDAEPDRVRRWQSRIGLSGFRIGVCWQGKPGLADKGRSFPLRSVAALAEIPGVRLISLQKGDGLEQLSSVPPGTVELLGQDFDAGPDGFLDTAAAMHSLDLIVTPDSSVAHLGGALGRPTWVALRFASDWRWLLDRENTPWYPTIRLFRQPAAGDWQSVFAAMAQAVSGLMARPRDPIAEDQSTA